MPNLNIIFEDEYILVVNKPAGIGTQAPRAFDSLEARIRQYLSATDSHGQPPYLGIPHRLDRCASGAMVFAKRKKAAQRLSKQFERREVRKTYLAIVSGKVEPTTGEWRDSLRKIPEVPRGEIVPESHSDAKLAVLHYEVEAQSEVTSRLRIQLETGRMHQIRIQCGSRGFPVLGDELYGSKQSFGPEFEHDRARQIALHAEELQFEHPRTRERVAFTATVPSCWPQS